MKKWNRNKPVNRIIIRSGNIPSINLTANYSFQYCLGR